LSVGVTPIVTHGVRARRVSWTPWVEVLLSCAGIALLWPLFALVSGNTPGRDARFADRQRAVVALPADVLPVVCQDYARHADRTITAEACGLGRLVAWSSASGASSRLGDALARARIATGASPSIACLSDVVSRAPSTDDRQSYASLALLAAAALNGRRITPGDAALPPPSRACAGVTVPQSLERVAAAMTDARRASTASAKDEAMRELLRTSGLQWAIAMLLGLAFVAASRRMRTPMLGAGLALVAWSVAGWAARVPWAFAGDHQFIAGRATMSLSSRPAPFVLAMAGAGIIAIAIALVARSRTLAQAPASRFGYPGFVLATGIGFLVLLDLSANASYGNRYLALYHQGHLWLAMTALCVVVMLRQAIGRALAWTLSLVDGLASGIGQRAGAVGSAIGLVALAALVSIAFGTLLSNMRQVTSEMGRLWLVVGAAWFFFMRGTPLAERLVRSGNSLASLARYVMPLAFVALALVGAMFVTRDMGPLLIAGYGAGAFLAASIAMWLQQRYGIVGLARVAAVVLFIGWIVAITAALFELGAIDDVTAGRLENIAAPLASANDQLALVTWFQQVAPPAGFGVGAVPWCGYGGGASCAGVPGQIQSDYTFTALVGVFGLSAAWTITLGCAWWLHRLIARHARATRGEPRLVAVGGRMVNDEQALLSWIAVTWVVLALCQLAVTVAGNLAVIPLTGVTFPFVSFGMTSLVAGAAMLGLCLNVNVPERSA
jgi:cell division protein FtsW (lipid II flippase)